MSKSYEKFTIFCEKKSQISLHKNLKIQCELFLRENLQWNVLCHCILYSTSITMIPLEFPLIFFLWITSIFTSTTFFFLKPRFQSWQAQNVYLFRFVVFILTFLPNENVANMYLTIFFTIFWRIEFSEILTFYFWHDFYFYTKFICAAHFFHGSTENQIFLNYRTLSIEHLYILTLF